MKYLNALACIVCMCCVHGCDLDPIAQAQRSDGAESVSAEPSNPESAPPLSDAPLDAYRVHLLELAFNSASAIPDDPHFNDKCRAQEAVVAACLSLNQLIRARSYAEQISDWRRGTALADVARQCAQRGDQKTAEQLLQTAATIADSATEWRRDRIRVAIASAYITLGNAPKADEFVTGTSEEEAGKLDSARATLADDSMLERQLAVVDHVAGYRDFDQLRNALEACAELFDRFYTDIPKRAQVEQKIKTSWQSLPVNLRVDLMVRLAEIALDHRDPASALKLLETAQQLMANETWPAEIGIPRQARLAGLRFRAGETAQANQDIDLALSHYLEQRHLMLNIDRAGVLCSIAGAYHTMGEADDAKWAYALAVDAGVENPNSRPRATDLTNTCISMAIAGVEPSAEVWARIRQIKFELGNPW